MAIHVEDLTTNEDREVLFDDDSEGEEDNTPIQEYELTSTPNDFNVATIYNFIESGAVRIPGFQRNYVWDHIRASKLIESLILGLPVPQLFLYQEGKNKFLVIDGQQRLMSVYYFVKQRFPKNDKRIALRQIFEHEGSIPDNVLANDEYFFDFTLRLPGKLPGSFGTFHGMTYSTLGDLKTQFDLRPIRNVIVKQNEPKDDDSSVYEIFYRLNSGGVNLKPMEIRASLYHSFFYDMLNRINTESEWRRHLGIPEPDLHMKDIEVLLRGFAMLIDGESYAPSMIRFLNRFSQKTRKFTNEQVLFLESLFKSFLRASAEIRELIFYSTTGRFNIALFEAVFSAVCKKPFTDGRVLEGTIASQLIDNLKDDEEFRSATLRATSSTANVKLRIARARNILGVD